MKKLTTFLLFAFALAFAAQAHTSRLILSLPSHDVYSVFVNGTNYPLESGRLILADLHPGSYHVSVMKHVPDLHRPGLFRSFKVAGGRVDVGAQQHIEGFLNHRGGLVFNRRQLHITEITPVPVDAAMFSALLERIEHAAFDRHRYAIAKEAVATRGMSAAQIAAVSRLFAFDHYRLDFAQFAYRHCYDPEHYFQVAETLTFQSNVRKLYAHMGR